MFDSIPKNQLYIFPGLAPPPIAQDHVQAPAGTSPLPMSFPWSQIAATPLQGGSVKIVDSTAFNVSKTIAAALVTVDVGGLRELHVSFGLLVCFW